MNETSDLYLMHHGIKGMHWGVRRFEDANGHLTPEGKRRYAVQDARKYYKINRLQRAREKTDNDKVKKALYKNPNTRALAPLALAGGAALTYGSAKKIPYYFMENRRYKQGNEKGATKKGLTKKQQALRTAGKVAAGAALAGVAGYALYKSGAGEAAINAGKNALEARTGIKFEKNPGKNFDSKSTYDTPSNSKKSSTSESSNKIYNAARQYAQGQQSKSSSSKPESISESSRRIYDAAKGAAGKQAKNAVSTAKNKARQAIRDKVMDGVDENDPRTWITAARNAKDTIGDIRRYGRAINKMRKGDAIGAAAEVSDELTDTTNKLIEGTQSRINKAKSSRGSRKGKNKLK